MPASSFCNRREHALPQHLPAPLGLCKPLFGTSNKLKSKLYSDVCRALCELPFPPLLLLYLCAQIRSFSTPNSLLILRCLSFCKSLCLSLKWHSPYLLFLLEPLEIKPGKRTNPDKDLICWVFSASPPCSQEVVLY